MGRTIILTAGSPVVVAVESVSPVLAVRMDTAAHTEPNTTDTEPIAVLIKQFKLYIFDGKASFHLGPLPACEAIVLPVTSGMVRIVSISMNVLTTTGIVERIRSAKMKTELSHVPARTDTKMKMDLVLLNKKNQQAALLR